MNDPTPEREVILEAQNLRKEFGGLVAIDDVSIRIHARTLHSIIGPNGAGKTTLFNLLSGTFPPTRGQIIFKGRTITHLPPHRIAHLGMGRSFQITNIFPNLTVLENVRLAAQAVGVSELAYDHERDPACDRHGAGDDPRDSLFRL
jgi:branched-chain amino acid transport system ATP-binding protein